jgi:TonB family protein
MRHGPRTIPERGRVASAWAFSVVGHAVALGLGGLLLASSLDRRVPVATVTPPPAPQKEDVVEIDLPTVVDGSQLLRPPPPPQLPSEALPRGGGEAMPRLDTGHAGRGGTDTSSTPAMNLADRDDELLLSPEVMSRLDSSQIQRLRASRRRASREDWRASREPMELTFLAEGRRDVRPDRPEHRKLSASNPSAGGRAWGPVARQGGALGAGELPPGIGEQARLVGSPIEGSAHASAGRGVRDGAPGEDHRDTALVAFARPYVNEGTPSVPSDVRDRPTDNVDAEQQVALRMQSILHASNAGGAAGPGTGGQAGRGAAGSGGKDGPGSISHALGTGQGDGVDVDPRDRRRSEYIRQIHAKLGPHTQWRQLISVATAAEGVQGVVTVTVTILADGSVAAASLTRSSGTPELDENYRRAVLKAAPFGPLPPELGTTFRLALPLDLRNPAVRPRTAAPAPAAKAEP